tara:strand:- start:1129 stop:1296 length:168 start_codon:yes stop_codon:yes gene_type:complete
MKVELTTEQADLLLLELSALIQEFDIGDEKLQQILDIRMQIAKAIVEKEGGVNYG